MENMRGSPSAGRPVSCACVFAGRVAGAVRTAPARASRNEQTVFIIAEAQGRDDDVGHFEGLVEDRDGVCDRGQVDDLDAGEHFGLE